MKETYKNDRLRKTLEELEKGVSEVFNSDEYKNYLIKMSQFHNYSFRNVLLIYRKNPEATLVAGYNTWAKKFKRFVKPGEKAIPILAPIPCSFKKQVKTINRYKVAYVFDVSQTEGEKLGPVFIEDLQGTVKGYAGLFDAARRSTTVPIKFGKTGNAKGYYSRAEKKIVIKPGMSEVKTLKTCVHEVAHSLMHSKGGVDTRTAEVQAESVAFVVLNHFGIDTDEYSFGHVTGWSSGKDMKELKASLDIIQRTAAKIIDSMTKSIKEEKLIHGRGIQGMMPSA